ncbi:MAG TPA: SGNH/GDSL hydrolase family protein [Candidatus Sumerlaeota bacterium]|nr:SGNH/GDSL hydrolase family protein [Candidatus Sumerlaeota bacterium]
MTSRPPLSRDRRLLFITWAVFLPVLVVAVALAIWALPLLRERRYLRYVIQTRLADQTLAGVGRAAIAPEDYAAWADHVRQCYREPSAVDLERISWNLRCRPMPFIGYAPEPGDQTEGAINAHQLRSRRPLVLPKPPGVFRVFLTGGSLAYSVGAPALESTIAGCLETALAQRPALAGWRVEVFNAAVPAWSSTHERIRIENDISRWEPDLVISLTGVNDAHWGFEGMDILSFRANEEIMYFELIRGGMRIAGAEPYAHAPPAMWGDPVDPGLVARRFAWNMSLAGDALRRAGVPFLVAIQPYLAAQYKPLTPGETSWLARHEDPGKMDYIDQAADAMLQALRAEAQTAAPPPFHIADLRRVFAQRDDPIFLDGLHVGDKGNALIAAALAEQVVAILTEESFGGG